MPTVTMSSSFPPDLADYVKEQAAAANMSWSAWVVQVVRDRQIADFWAGYNADMANLSPQGRAELAAWEATAEAGNAAVRAEAFAAGEGAPAGTPWADAA